MRRLFISDLHLDTPTSAQFLRFAECLDLESSRVEEIYILGDLVEMWIGDDDSSAFTTALVDVLKRTSEQCAVFLMHGNRDFLFGEQFAQHTGVTLLPDIYQPEPGLVLCHGDELCTDDAEYQQLRLQLRGSAWQSDFLARPLAERRAFGDDLRQRSMQENANKAESIMDANPQAIAQLIDTHQAAVLVHGHTHRPEVSSLGQEQRRVVLGAWERCGWLCRQHDQHFNLECFSLARRYGT
jgi:UDP-2,3-diacylglucosamine hydrolase